MLLIHEDQKIQNKSSNARKPSYSGGWVKKTEVEHNLSNNIRIILWKPTSKVLNPYKAYTKQIIWSKYYILYKVTVRKNREYIIFERNEIWASTLPQHQEVWILEIILYGFHFPDLKKNKRLDPSTSIAMFHDIININPHKIKKQRQEKAVRGKMFKKKAQQ